MYLIGFDVKCRKEENFNWLLKSNGSAREITNFMVNWVGGELSV